MHLDGPSADADSQRLSVHLTLARLRMTFFNMRAARTETSRSGVLTRVEFPASVCAIPMKHLKVVLIVVACVMLGMVLPEILAATCKVRVPSMMNWWVGIACGLLAIAFQL